MKSTIITCSTCGDRRPRYRQGSRQCKSCTTAAKADWARRTGANARNYEENRDAIRERQVWSRLMTRYGVTQEQYEAMLGKQNGLCAICENECKTGQRLVVDHNHDTGEVRGLLCKSCNFKLGTLEQEIWVEKALRYLHER